MDSGIRRICMVSSAVFGAASCVYGWAAPLGAALGLTVNLTEDSISTNKENFTDVVECALSRTRKDITSDSNKKIIDELFQHEIEPDSLKALIKKTEAYQTQYCTDINAKEIITVFEMYFRDEISHRPALSNLYILSSGFVTIEKLKMICDILYSNDKKLDGISKNVIRLTNIADKLTILCKKVLYSCAFIFVSMAFFLGLGIVFFALYNTVLDVNYSYDRSYLYIAPICYGLSDILMYFVKERIPFYRKINDTRRKIAHNDAKELNDMLISNMWLTFFMPLFISIASFLMIHLAFDYKRDILLLLSTTCLALGNVVSIRIKRNVILNSHIIEV